MVAVAAACGTTVPPSQRTASVGDLGPVGTRSTVATGSSEQASRRAEATTAVTSPTTTTGRVAGAAVPPGSAGAASPRDIATTGRGWDAKNVYIGVILSRDTSQSTGALGLDNIDPGDNTAQADAMAKYVNARGGLLGRRVVVRVDNHSLTASLSQPEVESQAACTKFVQDQPVAAVVNTLAPLDTPSLRKCFAAAGVPVFLTRTPAADADALANSTLVSTAAPTWGAFAPVLVESLVEQRYFTGWNTGAGGPGAAPVKLGIWMKDDEDSNRAFRELRAALAHAGHEPAVVFRYGNFASEAGNAVLQMRTAGVTHVIGLDAYLFAFAAAAESQGYRPRYGVHSGNTLYALLQANSPKAQLAGAVGLGYSPFGDVGSQSGELTPGGKLCHDVMAANGQTFQGKRGAEFFAMAICDAFRLAVDSMSAAHGLTANAVFAGLGTVGPGFTPASTFQSGVTATYHALPSAGADVRYEPSCTCFRYAGTSLRRLNE